MLTKRERIAVIRAILCVIFIINPRAGCPTIISFKPFFQGLERALDASEKEEEKEEEEKKKSARKKGREKRNKRRVSERQQDILLLHTYPLSLSLSSFFHSLFYSPFVSTFRETIKNWSLFAFSLYDNIVYSFFEAAVVSRPVTQPFGSNALFFDQENCHVLCPPRKEESNFLAFLTPSFQSLDKPADRRTNDPFPPFSPLLFFSVFVFFAQEVALFHPPCRRVSVQSKSQYAQHNDYEQLFSLRG